MKKKEQHSLIQVTLEKRKNPEKSSPTTKTKEKSVFSTQHQDEHSKINEIDLSCATSGQRESNKFISEKKNEKQKSGKDGSHISIMSPTEVVFNTEIQSQDVDLQKKRIKRDTSEKSRLSSSVPKTKKPSQAGVKQKRPVKKKTLSPKTTPQPVGLVPQAVTMSKGVAYLQGNMIKFVGGVKLRPGDEIRIREKEFVLKTGKRKKTPIYVSAVLLLIAGLIFLSPLFKSRNAGKLIGMVTEDKTRMSVPGAKIYLREAGITVKSNQLGFFMFESLPSGPYALQVSSEGYKSKSENVTIDQDQSTTLLVNLIPAPPAGLSTDLSAKTGSPKSSSGKKSSSRKSTVGSDYGKIRIKSNVSDPVVLIDNRLAGIGNKVYPEIEPGKHVIAVTKPGYYDWAQEVKIKPGKRLDLKITLSEDKTKQPDLQTWKDFIALGNRQLSSNDVASALSSYNQALTLKPTSPDALLGRGYTYMQMGDRLKATQDFEKSAELFLNEHDYQKAAVSYTNLVTLNDKNKDAYLNRGICYLKLEEPQKSIQDLKKAVKLDSGLFSGYLNLGQAHYKAGEYKLSIDAYKRARKLNSQSKLVFVGLTKAYFAKGDNSRAKKSYKKFEEFSTYIEREKLKHDPEWREVLEGIGEDSQPKL